MKEIRDSLREGREWINVREKDDVLDISICKAFSTPGYSIKVDKVVEENHIYYIYLSITPPNSKSILIQVISYKIINMEISKIYLKSSPPYTFKLKTNIPFYSTKKDKSIKEY